MEYKLSASLQGHDDDVRDVAFAGESAVVSASRDGTVRLWKKTSSQESKFDDTISSQGSAFVNAVTYILPSPEFPDGLIVSGGKDSIIDLRQPGRPPENDAERLLLGHQGNVCSLDVSPDAKSSYLVSGSWDGTAKVWDVAKGECTATLEGHEGSVWAVLAYNYEFIITGSADKRIRLFDTAGKLLRTIKGSTDVVRALCRVPPHTSAAQFASAGNDSIIRLWTLEGLEVAKLQGHENFVYSIAALPDGSIVSSSEDRTVRVWKDNACIQTITHPAISVWSVATCAANFDIVSGASDRIVRVFTTDKARYADAAVIEQFEEAVRSSSIPQQQMPEINKEKLPGPEFLQQKSGTKEGQVQMIREPNGNITAHQWSASGQQWLNVGTVVDAVGSSGRKQEYHGQDYDYVFDVDIEDGKPALKLPYNLSQNPYDVARKFVGDNELPITYLDQVANFIITNTQGATIGQSSESQPTGSDPWGQESRYRPDQPPSAPKPKIIPQTDYLTITTANFPMMFKKITDLNQTFLSGGRKDLAFSPTELRVLPSLSAELDSALKSQPAAEVSPVLSTGIDIAVKIVTKWPPESRIPGLDLLRCLAAATSTIATSYDFIAINETIYPVPKSAEAPIQNYVNAIMLSIRSFANLFAHAEGRTLVANNFTAIWRLIQPCLGASTPGHGDSTIQWNRNVHIAAMTLSINCAILFKQSVTASDGDIPASAGSVRQDAATMATDLIRFLTDPKIIDSETVYRAIVALGTLLFEPSLSILEADGTEANVRLALIKAEKSAKEPRIRAAITEVRALLG